MKVKNNTEAPQSKIDWCSLSLAIMHMIVLVLSLTVHPIKTHNSTRALP